MRRSLIVEDILLIEPAYKNKYPPIGLMKIAYFHRYIMHDYVRFAKGRLPEGLENKKWDRVYVTTLFTFEWENTKKALKQINVKTIALAGGVSAHSYIRNEFLKLEEKGIEVYMPDLKLCTDNAAMIASAGYYNFINGKRDELDLNAIPNLKL